MLQAAACSGQQRTRAAVPVDWELSLRPAQLELERSPADTDSDRDSALAGTWSTTGTVTNLQLVVSECA
eukprot:1228108-Rhodomonas_salina.1